MLSALEQSMTEQEMVDIHSVDSTIRVHLIYARKDNFTGEVLYTDLHHAFLHPKAAKALALAQKFLKEKHPTWSLIVFDACRPRRIQQKMWDKVKGTDEQNYVSNPAHGGGLHNYGMAVDISIVNAHGDTLSMGTRVDHMSYLSHINEESELVETGILSPQAHQHRQLLRRIMKKAGFHPLPSEWWHFNLIYRPEARKNYHYIK